MNVVPSALQLTMLPAWGISVTHAARERLAGSSSAAWFQHELLNALSRGLERIVNSDFKKLGTGLVGAAPSSCGLPPCVNDCAVASLPPASICGRSIAPTTTCAALQLSAWNN